LLKFWPHGKTILCLYFLTDIFVHVLEKGRELTFGYANLKGYTSQRCTDWWYCVLFV